MLNLTENEAVHMAKKSDKPPIGEDKKKELGVMAGQVARQGILDACEKVGLTVEKTAKTIVEAMDANAVKVQLNIQGKWMVSKPYTDHTTRLKAVEQSIVLLDLKPVDKKKIDMTAVLSDDEIDRQLEMLMKKGKKG
jgi:hypothetical protein